MERSHTDRSEIVPALLAAAEWDRPLELNMNLLSLIPLLSLCGHTLNECKSVQQGSIERLPSQARYERTVNLSPAPSRTVLTAADFRRLAVIYFNRGQFEDARKTFRRALQLLDQNSPASGIESARTYQL